MLRALCSGMSSLLLVAACAVSPQTIDLELQPVAVHTGQGQRLGLTVLDLRSDDRLGSLGGTYDTAYLRLHQQALAELERVSRDSFREGNWSISDSSTVDQELTLALQTLQYQKVRAPQWPLWDLVLFIEVSYSLRNYRGEFESQYRLRQEHRVWPQPKQADNQEYVNQIVQDAWRMMMQDPQLAALLVP